MRRRDEGRPYSWADTLRRMSQYANSGLRMNSLRKVGSGEGWKERKEGLKGGKLKVERIGGNKWIVLQGIQERNIRLKK